MGGREHPCTYELELRPSLKEHREAVINAVTESGCVRFEREGWIMVRTVFVLYTGANQFDDNGLRNVCMDSVSDGLPIHWIDRRRILSR